MIITYYIEHFVQFAGDFLVEIVRKGINMALLGLGRTTRFLNSVEGHQHWPGWNQSGLLVLGIWTSSILISRNE